MIHLITGLPGNAKTLLMLQLVIERAAKEGREVYYSGIKEFKKDDPRLMGTKWTEFDPLKWHETVPKGAIMAIDEVQTLFRARAITSNPPAYVTGLEQHRHDGQDFYVTTQHPRLIDPALKVLTQDHRHLIRIYGAEMSTIHFWDGVREKPESAPAKKESQKTTWAFAKDLYGLYKSADVHTMQKKIPLRVKLLALAPVVVIACGYFTYKTLHKITPGAEDKKVEQAKAGTTSGPLGVAVPTLPAASTKPAFDPVQDAKEYVEKRTPRVEGLAFTAPVYDALTVPTHVPIPAMCISKTSHDGKTVTCKCYSQQATPLDVKFNMCIEFSRNGYFREFDADRDQERVARSEASQKALQRVPDAPLPEHAQMAGGGVTVIPGQPMGPARTEKSPALGVTGEIQDGPPNNRATRAAAGNVVAGL